MGFINKKKKSISRAISELIKYEFIVYHESYITTDVPTSRLLYNQNNSRTGWKLIIILDNQKT